jgi:SynChlorMet cassette radical SAM/SPASM protein ScmE
MNLIKTPRSLDLEITNRCNLRCKYCSHFTSAGDVDSDLPKEEWLKFFEELNRCAVMDVTISGGEAFCREDLKELVDGVVRNRMRFGILSNGTLITDEISEFLASTGRCNSVQVSIDGSIPMTHDVFRGKGNFVKAVNGLKSLQKYKISVTVRVTIHKQNVDDLESVTKLLLEDIGLPSFSTNSASYMGLCRQNAEQVQLTIEERSVAMETLLKLNKKYNGRIGANAGPLAEAQGWLMMEKARREGKEAIPGRGCLTGCGGFMSKLAVRADGVITPCGQMGHIELGRINHDDLKEVWQNHPELKRLRERRNIPLNDFEFCSGCEYINYCTGSCPALAYTIIGVENHPSPDSCLRQFINEGGRLPDESLLQ